MSKGITFAALFAAAALHAPQTRAAEVVVSIKPIHSLVAAVMGNTGRPLLLLKSGASPHTYRMRPSEARALTRADLIVWIGKELEEHHQQHDAGYAAQNERYGADDAGQRGPVGGAPGRFGRFGQIRRFRRVVVADRDRPAERVVLMTVYLRGAVSGPCAAPIRAPGHAP